MKNVVILFGLLLVTSTRSQENYEEEIPVAQSLRSSFLTCMKVMNSSKVEISKNPRQINHSVIDLDVITDIVKDVLEGRNLHHREGNCFLSCILQLLGIFRNSKTNFVKAEEFLKAVNEDDASVGELLERMKNECQERAESNRDDCDMAEIYTKCFVRIRNEIVPAKRDGDDLNYSYTIL